MRTHKLDTHCLAELHGIILNNGVTATASHLKVDVRTLHRHLSKYKCRNQPITFDMLKKLSQIDAVLVWGEAYKLPLAQLLPKQVVKIEPKAATLKRKRLSATPTLFQQVPTGTIMPPLSQYLSPDCSMFKLWKEVNENTEYDTPLASRP